MHDADFMPGNTWVPGKRFSAIFEGAETPRPLRRLIGVSSALTDRPEEPTPDVAAIVIGGDADRVGSVVADLTARGVRAAAFIGDPASDRDAVVEMLAELFGRRPDES